MKTISNLVGLLVVIAIVVAVFVGLNTVVLSVVEKNTPDIVDLTIGSGNGILSENTLILRLVVTPVGVEPVSITNIRVYKGSAEINYVSSTIHSPSKLKPGDTYEVIVIFYGVTSISPGDTLTVIVEWTSDSTSGASMHRVHIVAH